MGNKRTHDQKRQAKQRLENLKKQKREAALSAGSSEVELPSQVSMEQSMRGLFGSGKSKKSDQAQELAYQAMEMTDPIKSSKLALKALELDPYCVDAAMHLARLSCPEKEDLIKHMKMVVDIGVRSLGGPKYFEENQGYFWGLLETRPYMRARAYLAQILTETGHYKEAIEHYEEMLKLNPNDNQGLRDPLLGLYLLVNDLEGARRLLAEYEKDGSAVFAWGKVLERFLSDNITDAEAALQKARQTNPHAEKYLTGRKQLPKELPAYYGFGDENEAIVCADEIGAAWKKYPNAIQWLRDQH
jgi:tetratricopeptide (TPR) repeat protein